MPIAVVGLLVVVSAAAAGLSVSASPSQTLSISAQNAGSHTPEPNWNTGNLCQGGVSISGDQWTCQSSQPSPAPPNELYLYWNFSAPRYTTIDIQISEYFPCVTLNFHGFFNDITIDLTGSHYGCVNVMVNSQGDQVTVKTTGSDFVSNYFLTVDHNVLDFSATGSGTTTNVYYIATAAGFDPCPSGRATGKVTEGSISATGSDTLLNTIWVNGAKWSTLSTPYNLIGWTGPTSPGHGNELGFENTSTAPAGGCGYLFPGEVVAGPMNVNASSATPVASLRESK